MNNYSSKYFSSSFSSFCLLRFRGRYQSNTSLLHIVRKSATGPRVRIVTLAPIADRAAFRNTWYRRIRPPNLCTSAMSRGQQRPKNEVHVPQHCDGCQKSLSSIRGITWMSRTLHICQTPSTSTPTHRRCVPSPRLLRPLSRCAFHARCQDIL